ncbi:Neuromedin-U receptor 2 [Holothuria leucospilota]|uniref:Neuromedin-U receptor 2 n=1 Tax=Holothuria leucospilota TaxID=206669 RepID=A0A9Q1H9L9_HOLLE|nr:Neuromedin-U receptor 2 [Holothuria leucospilota]
MAEISSDIDIYSFSDSFEYYSVSYYDYIASDECAGFGWNLLNSTNEKIDSLLNPFLLQIIVLYLQPLVAVFGVIGNLAFIFIVFKVPYMRNRINTILLNLSVADFLYLLVGTGEKFVKIIHSPVLNDSSVFGQICQCFIITPLVNAVSFMSLLLISLISVERYIAVCRPHQYVKLTDCRRTLVYMGSVWIFSFALAVLLIPSRLDFSVTCIQWPDTPLYANFPAKVGFCDAKSDFWVSLDECLQTFPFFIALTVNVVCFAKITAGLYSRMAPSCKIRQSQLHEHRGKVKKPPTHIVTRMLLINGIAFFVLATPFHVTNAVQFIENIIPEWWCNCSEFKEMSVLFLYMNSAVNPLIYGITNPTYRRAYRSFFLEMRYSSQRRQSTISSSDSPSDRRTTSI